MTDTHCSFGHTGDDHHDNTGRCHGTCHNSEYGTYTCLCPYYTQEKL